MEHNSPSFHTTFPLSLFLTPFLIPMQEWHIVLTSREIEWTGDRKKDSSEQKRKKRCRARESSGRARYNESVCKPFDLWPLWVLPLLSYKWPLISHRYECTTVHLFLHGQDLHQDLSTDFQKAHKLITFFYFFYLVFSENAPVFVYFYILLDFSYLIPSPIIVNL